MGVMEGCVVAIKVGHAAEVELAAFVTVRGVEVWPTAAVDQPPPQSQALKHTALTLCVSDWVCVCVCVCMWVPQACPSDTL